MESKSVEKLIKKVFGDLIVFILERTWRSILALIFIILFLPPLVEYVHSLLKQIPYIKIIGDIWFFLSSILTIKDVIFLVLFITVLTWLNLIASRQRKLTMIRENFEDLRKWNIPLNCHWLIEKTSDKSTKSLGLSSSYFPGLLKPAYNWYDYSLTFSAKLKKELCIIVRAVSSSNGIMFKLTTDKITPYIICNGDYIEDDKNVEELPVLLKQDQWVDNITITVKGNIVNIQIKDIGIQYKIPSTNLRVEDDVLFFGSANMSALIASDKKVGEASQKWLNLMNQESKESDPIKKEEISKKKDIAFDEYDKIKYKMITLDYQSGSIGFKNDDKEMALINELTVKQI